MKADIHIHSIYSNDGKLTVEEIIKIMEKSGFDLIAITDHNSFKAHQKSYNSRIKILKGIEVSSCCGHILALNVSEEIKRGMSIEETIEKIHDLGGIAIAAHPYRFWSGLGEENTRKYNFDAIEVLNGRSFKKDNEKAKRLADELDKPMTAGSDAHLENEFGRVWMEYESDILDDILKRKVRLNGYSRDAKSTINYVYRSVSLWIKRGFKKI
ncbi:MAG: PHP domain-containing protein [Thermoplasmata archaeon]|jgi:predicted metal-dependent phosphoesterase TrpH